MRRSLISRLPSDIVAGISAVIAFLGMLGIMGVGYLWLSAILSVGVYAGLRILLPAKTDSMEAPPVSLEERIARLAQLAPQLVQPDAKRRLSAIMERATTLSAYCANHSDASADVVFMARQYLEFCESGLRLYLVTSNRVENVSRQSVATLNEMLESVLTRLSRILEKTQAADDAAVAIELRSLTKTLQELDRVCLSLGEEDTP